MAAPVAAVRVIPDGTHLFDGFPAKVTFTLDPDVEVWEKRITPSGIDGRDPVDQTTMWNQVWTTNSPRKLKTLMNITMVCAYDPEAFANLDAMVNIVQGITHKWSDLSTLAFWGFLQKVELNELQEGQQPEMTLTIVPSNLDPSALAGAPTEFARVLSTTTGTNDFYWLST